MTDAETIAQGGQAAWEHAFTHLDHEQPLTFRIAKLPTGMDWLRVAQRQELIAPGVTQGTGAMLAEAIAGLTVLAELPVLKEDRIEDPDEPSHVKLERTFYDPESDERWEFPVVVWNHFLMRRAEILSPDTQEQVKNSSGATSGPESDAKSPSATDSPRSTPESSS